MSEKRFELSESVITDYRIYDYKQEDAYFISCAKHTAECLVDLLNYLNYENEELTISIKLFEDDVKRLNEGNEQLKEQLQMIERIIQTQISELEEDLRVSIKAGMPTGGMYSEIEFLEELKKECFDE